MQISYDERADAMYLTFQKDEVAETLKIQDGIMIDINKEGNLLGLEILDVSKRMPLATMEHIAIDLPIEKPSVLKEK